MAEGFVPIVYDESAEPLYLREKVYFLKNDQNPRPAEEILSGNLDASFEPNRGFGLNLGYPSRIQVGDYWLAMIIENRTAHDIALTVHSSSTPSLSRVFFLDTSSRVIRTSACSSSSYFSMTSWASALTFQAGSGPFEFCWLFGL
jgi:hypothetical protein